MFDSYTCVYIGTIHNTIAKLQCTILLSMECSPGSSPNLASFPGSLIFLACIANGSGSLETRLVLFILLVVCIYRWKDDVESATSKGVEEMAKEKSTLQQFKETICGRNQLIHPLRIMVIIYMSHSRVVYTTCILRGIKDQVGLWKHNISLCFDTAYLRPCIHPVSH